MQALLVPAISDYTQDRQDLLFCLRRTDMAGGLSLLVTANFNGVQYKIMTALSFPAAISLGTAGK